MEGQAVTSAIRRYYNSWCCLPAETLEVCLGPYCSTVQFAAVSEHQELIPLGVLGDGYRHKFGLSYSCYLIDE